MGSLSEVLQNSRQALQVHQLAMQVIGNNTANVNTEGYSRRRIELTTGAPHEFLGNWNGGGGVDVQWLGRVRDRIIDDQIRSNASDTSYWSTKSDLLGRVEEVFDELSGAAISDSLQEFWSSWQDLSNNPEGSSARLALRQKAEVLASSVRRAHSELTARQSELSAQIEDTATEINGLTSRIAELNVSIINGENRGSEASDLRDMRDSQIEQLAAIIPVTAHEDMTGSVNLYLEGQIIVQADEAIELVIANQSSGTGIRSTVQVGIHGAIVHPTTGSLRALQDLRDEELASAIQHLNEFAVALSENVNRIHVTGFGLEGSNGVEFFDPNVTDASNFGLSAFIEQDVNYIATASTTGSPGDNSIALAIAGIQSEKIMNGNRSTLGEFYTDSVLQVGSKREHAADQLDIHQGVMDNLVARRASVSGVSMDEEMARLIQVQAAYDAAAKVITVVDEMLQTVLNL